MPAEVISLLSSSPAAPSPVDAIPAQLPPRTNFNFPAPYRALDYDILDLTAAIPKKVQPISAARISAQPTAGTKRTSSGHHRHHHEEEEEDALFVSDDFDTTGDLDASFTKRSRLSPLAPRAATNDVSSLKRTKSAVVGTKSYEQLHPLQPAGMRRWNTMADPIQYSSSPHGIAVNSYHNTQDENLSDPFASPPKKQPIHRTSARPVLADPFESPLKMTNNIGPSSWNWPQDMSKPAPKSPMVIPEKKRSNVAFIDLSSDPFGASPVKVQPKAPKQKAAWDPISSSAPEARPTDDLVSSPPPPPPRTALAIDLDNLYDSESDGLPDLGDLDFSKLRAKKRSYSLSPRPKSKVTKKPAKPRNAPKSAEEKEREKRQKEKAREAEKERKRIEKERDKEERAATKGKEKALAEVNKLRTDKKMSTPEMIVDLPASLNAGLKVQVETLLDQLDVQHESWNSRVENVVKWRRKVASKYNEDMGHWEPIPMRIMNEKHVAVLVQAAEFVKFVLGAEGEDLEAHVLKMKTNFPNTTIIYLIEGLTAWMRKNRIVKNRQFASAVRNLDPNGDDTAPSSSLARRRKTKQPQEYIDEDSIEDALLSLQVVHGTLIHHTNHQVETAQWVKVFTQHISTIPYRKARDAGADAGFCMDAGQIRSGENAKDTYVRMLQEITRVTAPIAYGIAAKYGTVTELVQGLEAEGPLALEECRKSANKDGAFTDRNVGQAISRRVHKIFTGRDPGTTDV
ncbi:Uu.00g075220.m01.CDS01 [Anthostomella pinea]|uniref:Uu.00g075220.m01.CDS01 n=1 Tax=Anthostomella pinea TaxID=933095 RepID=A0AAI8YLQ5_9PEZI|nr:Uu.00g075220.m01.CDS01 [Anthostomella pinea]